MNDRRRGFTLIELLVALAIFSVASLLAYRAMGSVMQMQERLSIENKRWRDLSLAFSQLEQNMRMAVGRPVRDDRNNVMPALAGGPAQTGGSAQLSVSSLGSVWQTGAAADVVRRDYRLNDGALEQIAWPALDRSYRTEPSSTVILENVRVFELRFMDANGQWQIKWPVTAEKTILPAAVEVTIELNDGLRITRIFSLR